MIVTPVPFTSSEPEAKHMKMTYKVTYTWHYTPKDSNGEGIVWVWDKRDGQIVIDYWNRPSSFDTWQYTLTGVEKV